MSELFNNSLKNVVSFFASQKNKISIEELDELKDFVETEIEKTKKTAQNR